MNADESLTETVAPEQPRDYSGAIERGLREGSIREYVADPEPDSAPQRDAKGRFTAFGEPMPDFPVGREAELRDGGYEPLPDDSPEKFGDKPRLALEHLAADELPEKAALTLRQAADRAALVKEAERNRAEAQAGENSAAEILRDRF